MLAIDAALAAKRDVLWTDISYPSEWVAALDDYATVLADEMGRGERGVVALARFEVELQHARNELESAFEPLVAGQRRALDRARTSVTLARGAQWTVLAASMLALGLLVALGYAARRLAMHATPAGPPVPRAAELERTIHGEPIDVLSLVDRVTNAYQSRRPYGVPRIRFEARMGLVVHGTPDRVARVLARLVALADAEARVASEIVIYTAARLGHVRLTVRCEVAPHSALPPESDLRECRDLLAGLGGACGVEQRGDLRAYWFTLPAAPMS